MNDLYGKQLAQKRELTEPRKQFLSKYCLLFWLSTERPNFSVPFVRDVCLHANTNVHIDKMIITSSFQRTSFRNISYSQNLSHHNFRCPPFNLKTCLNGSVRFPNIILERRILSLFLVEQRIVLEPVIYVGNRTFRRGHQSLLGDHIVGTIEKLTAK